MPTTPSHRPAPDPARLDESVPVLVVGGGIVGLSAALFLARQGVRPLLVERHPDLLSHPRARGFTQRTVELYRQAGIEPAIRAVVFDTLAGQDWISVRGETLAGDWQPVEEPADDAVLAGASPCAFAQIDQDRLEAIVRERARDLGADLRFGTRLDGFEQDADGVTACLTNLASGEARTVRADWMVAADGRGGDTRAALGIPEDGPGIFSEVVTLMADADLTPALRGRPVSIAYLDRPRPHSALMAHRPDGRHWVFGTGADPSERSGFTDEQGIAFVRAAAGLPDVAVTLRPQIPGTDRKALWWPIGAAVARRFREGRVFLAGDAAHIVPPTGGFGANTGIQDAHDLAWKLAAVVGGQAGPALLDSYEAERRPAALTTMAQSLARAQSRMGFGDPDAASRLLSYGTVAFGLVYRSAAVVEPLPGDTGALPVDALRGQPGTRAPHVWLAGREGRVSTMDLFGDGFLLLAGADGGAWAGAAETVAARLGLPLAAVRVDRAADPAAAWAAAYDAAPAAAVLVRPDGYVAWRAETVPPDPRAALAEAMGTVLGRVPAAAR